MFKNMSLLKTKLPGLLPSVVCTPALIACVAMESASSYPRRLLGARRSFVGMNDLGRNYET